MNKITQNTQSAKDAPKVEIEVKTPVAMDVQPKPETTSSPKSKKTTMKNNTPKAEDKKPEDKAKGDAPKTEGKKPATKVESNHTTKADPEKIDLSKVAPLKVDKSLLESKRGKLTEKLEKEKRKTTAKAFHVSYGYFLCKANSGKVLTIEYHETLKPAKWLIRDDTGKVIINEPLATLWKAHETAVKL